MPDRIELRNEELRTQPLYAGRVVSGGLSCLTWVLVKSFTRG
jgi:hypothetical protein